MHNLVKSYIASKLNVISDRVCLPPNFNPSPDDFVFDKNLFPNKTIKTLSGVPPLSFTAKGLVLAEWSITGNTVQDGTPTPDNPVEVVGVGDRTANLLKIDDIPITTSEKGITYRVENGVLYINGTLTSTSGIKLVLAKNITFKAGTYTNKIFGYLGEKIYFSFDNLNSTMVSPPNLLYRTFTLNEDTIFSEAMIWINPGSDFENTEIRILTAEGSTAIEYEPYGYKIPIATSTDGTEPITTPIYLSEPLQAGEVLRSDGTVTRSDGTTETVTVPQIPTFDGTTAIDVATTVPPAEMYIKYK